MTSIQAKQAAHDARNAAYAAAEAIYDADLSAVERSDRAGVHAVTAKYEAALAKARADYNAVMFPGVFAA